MLLTPAACPPILLLAVSNASCCNASLAGVLDASGPAAASMVRTAAAERCGYTPPAAGCCPAATAAVSALLRDDSSSSENSACRMRATTLLTVSCASLALPAPLLLKPPVLLQVPRSVFLLSCTHSCCNRVRASGRALGSCNRGTHKCEPCRLLPCTL